MNDCDEFPALAVRTAACEVDTVETFAVKFALEEPEGTVTEAGTFTALLLLASVTTWPVLGAAVVNVAVQLSVAAPVMEDDVQVKLRIVTGLMEFLNFFPCWARTNGAALKKMSTHEHTNFCMKQPHLSCFGYCFF